MDTITLQVPMDKVLRNKATKMAKKEGFSSLQEFVRVGLTMFAKGELNFYPNFGRKLGDK